MKVSQAGRAIRRRQMMKPLSIPVNQHWRQAASQAMAAYFSGLKIASPNSTRQYWAQKAGHAFPPALCPWTTFIKSMYHGRILNSKPQTCIFCVQSAIKFLWTTVCVSWALTLPLISEILYTFPLSLNSPWDTVTASIQEPGSQDILFSVARAWFWTLVSQGHAC